jgi:hypothetical protein
VGETAAIAPDGFCALRLRIAPGESAAGPDPASGAGQFWLVLAGHLRLGGTALPAMSCVFVHPDEPQFTANAGADGLQVLAMQFPRPD